MSVLMDTPQQLVPDLQDLIADVQAPTTWTNEAIANLRARKATALSKFEADADPRSLVEFLLAVHCCDRLYSNPDYRLAVQSSSEGDSHGPGIEVADLLNELKDSLGRVRA